MNKVIVIGRLVKDIELKMTSNGIAVASFSLAVSRDYKKENGERETDFLDLVAYKKTAELLNQYTSKGNQIAVEGKLYTRFYDDKNGAKHKVYEIIVENIQLLESKKDNTQLKPSIETQKQAEDFYDTKSGVNISEEDLPF